MILYDFPRAPNPMRVNIFLNEKKITSLLVVSDRDYKKRNKVLKGIIHIHFLLDRGFS